MAEVVAVVVVEPSGGLITPQNKPIQSNRPAVADTWHCSVNPALTKGDLHRADTSSSSMLLSSIYCTLHVQWHCMKQAMQPTPVQVFFFFFNALF